MLRRLVLAGLAIAVASPVFSIAPASAVILFSCSSATVAATITPGLSHNQTAQTVTSTGTLGGCGSGGGGSGTLTAGTLASFPPRPLGCPTSQGGAGPDYTDQTPLLLGSDPSFDIDWAAGANSTGIAKVKASDVAGELKIVFSITAGQYTPPSGQKTKLKGSILLTGTTDTFTCADDSDPVSNPTFVNSGGLIVKQA